MTSESKLYIHESSRSLKCPSRGFVHGSLLSGVTQPRQYTADPYRKVHELRLEDGTLEVFPLLEAKDKYIVLYHVTRIPGNLHCNIISRSRAPSSPSSSYSASSRAVRLLVFGRTVSMTSVTLSSVLDNSGAS